MPCRFLTFVAVLAAIGALPGCASRAPSAPPAPASSATSGAAAPTADDPAAVLPGIDLDGLTPEQQRSVAELALSEFCYCGCPHTVSGCLREHASCDHAKRMATQAVRLARGGAKRADLQRILADYYAGFDRRARLDVAAYGPPLGDEQAPVTLVEFSDFTCPFCKQFRPTLEAFVQAHAGRVKLYYKPFPIQGHPYAVEAAQAVEWAREHGIFWPLHDRLFEAEGELSPEVLAGHVEALGGDGDALTSALTAGTFRRRVEAAQAEGRAAGMRGTPTLFMNGRRLPDLGEDALEHALADEEEWLKSGGWARD
jgi:protein-disulfide isomerase